MRVKKKETPENKAAGKIGVGGKIKVGEIIKTPSGDRPTSLDYFRATSENADYVAAFHTGCGEKPKNLSIMFTSNEACQEWMELRDKAGKMFAKSDGETVWRIAQVGNTIKTDFVIVTPAEADKFGGYQGLCDALAARAGAGCVWKHKCSLEFIIIDVKNILTQWRFETAGSKSSVDSIVNAFDAIKGMLGTVKGLVFDLAVKKVKSDKAGDKSFYPVVSLTCNMGLTNIEKLGGYLASGVFSGSDLLLLNDTKFLALEATKQAALPAPKTISID